MDKIKKVYWSLSELSRLNGHSYKQILGTVHRAVKMGTIRPQTNRRNVVKLTEPQVKKLFPKLNLTEFAKTEI